MNDLTTWQQVMLFVSDLIPLQRFVLGPLWRTRWLTLLPLQQLNMTIGSLSFVSIITIVIRL